ncbi:MAG TPA: hypothetical protein DDW52_00955, partial [Planctomycetaceae bacterium]|nr:hypothetical protein [Planctomycetaceae bacterium]
MCLWKERPRTLTGEVPGPDDDVAIQLKDESIVTFSSGEFVINSLVIDSPLQISGGRLSITGELYVGNRLEITGGVLADAQIESTDPAFLLLRSARLDGVVMDSDLSVNDTDLFVMNGLTLNGELIVGGPEGQGRIWFDGTQTLGGNGTVILNAEPNEEVTGLLIRNDGDTLTIGENMTVRGRKGYIGVSPNGGGSTDGILVNEGTIQSEGDAIYLNAGSNRSTGTLRAVEGARLVLERPIDNSNNTLRLEGEGT